MNYKIRLILNSYQKYKYIGENLTKNMKDLQNENCMTLRNQRQKRMIKG